MSKVDFMIFDKNLMIFCVILSMKNPEPVTSSTSFGPNAQISKMYSLVQKSDKLIYTLQYCINLL